MIAAHDALWPDLRCMHYSSLLAVWQKQGSNCLIRKNPYRRSLSAVITSAVSRLRPCLTIFLNSAFCSACDIWLYAWYPRYLCRPALVWDTPELLSHLLASNLCVMPRVVFAPKAHLHRGKARYRSGAAISRLGRSPTLLTVGTRLWHASIGSCDASVR